MFGLSGARVVLTGAGGGLGRALVAGLVAEGAEVVACDLPGMAPGAAAKAHGFDFRDRDAALSAAEAILAGGAPSVIVLNAGWTRAPTLEDTDPRALSEELEGNFANAALFAAALLPAMRAAGGSVVAVASVNALAHFGNPAYSAAKAALLAWVRAVAVEEGPRGLRANAVIPASIRTGAWEGRLKRDPGILDRLSRLYPLGRIVTPEEVANAVLFLASPLASGITGTTLTVDAGLTAGNLPFLEAIRDLGA